MSSPWSTAVEGLRDRLRGPLLTPQDPAYEEARTLWNAMIDERPALIARCTGAADVRSAVTFAHRDAAFSSTIAPEWEEPGRDEEMTGWARSFHEAVQPYAADGVYVNYLDQDESDRVADAYRGRYERLVTLKNEWDPDNLFRVNQNIEPTE